MRVALVHDWLTGMRGGEKVLDVFCEVFPQADLFTLVHVPGTVSSRIEDRTVHVSALSKVPGIRSTYRKFLPLFPRLIESFDLSGFDFVLSTSSCVAKGVRPASHSRHVSYVHSPMRYMWDRFDDYFGPGRAGWATRWGARLFRRSLQRWDRSSASRVDHFVANSTFVAGRIQDYYGRESEVIAPPVDEQFLNPPNVSRSERWLVVSAFAPYKRVEVALEAAEIANVPLDVVGRGPEEANLRRRAGPNTRFLGSVEDSELVRLYAGARGLLFPGVEDFGITPLEAMGGGCPVIAFGAGGALETVRGAEWEGASPGENDSSEPTGLFVATQDANAFARAIRALETGEVAISEEACRVRAAEFSRGAFLNRIRAAVPRWVDPSS